MEKFRSKSCSHGRMQLESYYGGKPTPTSMHDLRSYSVSYAGSVPPNKLSKEVKMKEGRRNIGLSSKSWSFNDPEFQRRKRVASYNFYATEGKMKGSFRKSFRWIKKTYSQVFYGWS